MVAIFLEFWLKKLENKIMQGFNAILSINRVQAQVVAAPDGISTIVSPNGNQIDINGEQLAGDKANLFHFKLRPERVVSQDWLNNAIISFTL
ncbi:MAG TPA: hypothetical protein VE944_07580 [Nostoc sp.]|uniref:hypothetical protein n=1 Tax=Nostoc sp. TaxID=1180 RepID=UPI002D298713|nr:hypothetical protein [Nostoc sp.]HYX14216.1 hypothetical protein [Nostoc sp.]